MNCGNAPERSSGNGGRAAHPERGLLTKSQLVFELGKQLLAKGHEVVVSGVMEQAKDNYAMLRDPVKSFRTSPDDIYLGGNLIKPCISA